MNQCTFALLLTMSDGMERPLLQHQRRLLGVPTIKAAQRFGAETFLIEEAGGVRQMRIARIGDVVLIDHPADASGPHSINCYFVEVEEAAALGADGKEVQDRAAAPALFAAVEAQRQFSLAARARSAALVRFRRCYVVWCAG
jgi:hypothetical protein